MVISVSKDQRNNVLKAMSFYDFDTFSCLDGNEFKIKLKKEIGKTRYCDVVYEKFDKKIKKDYERNEKLLLKALLSVFRYYNEKVYIVRYDDTWLHNKRIAYKLHRLFEQNSIRDEVDSIQTNDIEIIEAICKSILKGNTSAYFVLSQNRIFIAPTDHMDFFVVGEHDFIKPLRKIIMSLSKDNIFSLSKR